MAGLVMDSAGNLYGTTSAGGTDSDGVVFELAKGSGTITDLAWFDLSDGGTPDASLLLDSAGNLYGTTFNGGNPGNGTVFEVARGSGTITTLASFNGLNGQAPVAGLVMDSAGNLYGTTESGGQITVDGVTEFGDGTVFELPHGSSTITTLFTFDGTDGGIPRDSLTLDSSGNLYGTTFQGGASGDGTVFELPSGSGAITTLFNFSGANGEFLQANVIMDSAGNLYGTTDDGGTSDFGTVFELTPLELETVTSASPALTTTPGGTVVLGSGAKLTDSATLSGGFNPTGTITFTLYAPNGTTVVDTETDPVSGNGTYTTPNGYVPQGIGTYQWVVTYTGDSNNNPVASTQGTERESANPAILTLVTTPGG